MTKQEVNFQIRNIEIVEVYLKNPDTPIQKECEYNFDVSIEHRINGDDKLIVVALTISIRINNGETVNGRVKSNIFFQVNNIDDFQIPETKEYRIPEFFITTLNSISLSTSRGIIFSQFKGTFLHGAILPVVNPTDLKKE